VADDRGRDDADQAGAQTQDGDRHVEQHHQEELDADPAGQGPGPLERVHRSGAVQAGRVGHQRVAEPQVEEDRQVEQAHQAHGGSDLPLSEIEAAPDGDRHGDEEQEGDRGHEKEEQLEEVNQEHAEPAAVGLEQLLELVVAILHDPLDTQVVAGLEPRGDRHDSDGEEHADAHDRHEDPQDVLHVLDVVRLEVSPATAGTEGLDHHQDQTADPHGQGSLHQDLPGALQCTDRLEGLGLVHAQGR